MSTVKITELPAISVVNANTANTVLVGVDIQTDITGKITLTTLAAGLYSNNILRVGNNDIVLTNAVAQFTGNANNYLQVTLRNQTSNGSGDYVVTANDGSDSDHYIDLGINGSTYSDSTYSATKAHDGYLYLQSSGTNKGNLVVGTTNSQGKVNFAVGGLETDNIVGYISTSGIFSKGIDSVVTANAASANSVVNSRISANVATLRGEITANAVSANSVINTRITANAESTNAFANLAFTRANNAIANTNGVITAGDFYISGNGYVTGTFEIDNGIIYVPTVLAGSQTAFTINFATTSLIKANIAADCTITLSNYVPGKVVEILILNASGVGRTVTHGCSAENSTINSTTVTLAATSSAYLRYFSIGNNNANTFVAIQNA